MKKKDIIEENELPVIKETKRWLFFALPFTFTKYILNDKCLKLKKGFLTTTEDDILLFRIMDISYKRTLFQKMSGLGTITVISEDKTNPELVIKNIKRSREFKSNLDDRIEKERIRMRYKVSEIFDSDEDDDNNK